MIKVEKIDVWGFEHAIRGMRNPMNSWDKSDSGIGCKDAVCKSCGYFNACRRRYESYNIGKNDLELMRKLYSGGSEHRKYLRQIMVSMDITAPLYWWKEFDTYKIGTVANSCSTMHKIHDKIFVLDDFSHEHLCEASIDHLEILIDWLNSCRKSYVEQKHKEDWWQLIQLLPTSYNQKRTVTMNYENVVNITHQRVGHKLSEWNDFLDILCKLPYVDEITREKMEEVEMYE